MSARMSNPASVLPDATAGVQQIFRAIHSGGLPQQVLELVHMRVSQLNGCSACVDAGVASATSAGVSTDELLATAAWRESHLFDEAQRVALEFAESITTLDQHPGRAVDDDLWQRATKHYNEEQLAALVLMISLTNFFNRLNTTVRQPTGTRWSS